MDRAEVVCWRETKERLFGEAGIVWVGPSGGPSSSGAFTKQPGYAIHSLFGRKIIRISKYLLEISGNYLRLHAENTTIPVSKVHDVRWQDSTVMDYMPGRGFDEIRDTLNADQLSITGQLHYYISKLRDLKGNYIGAVDSGKEWAACQ